MRRHFFVSSFVRLTRADLGFDRSDLLVVSSVAGIRGTVGEVVRHLESVPGVVSVGGAAAGSPPLIAAGFEGGSSGTRLPMPHAPAAFVNVEFNRVSARYFAAASIPVLRGRVFGDGDTMSSPVVVLDELAARQLFGDTDPIGRELITHGRTRVSVAGVVANVRMRGPEADSSPQAYFPGPAHGDNYAYLVRTSGDASKMIPAVQAAFASLRAEGSRPAQVRRVEDAFRNITARQRFSAGTMAALFGLLALLIGATGVYGVMSSLIAQRTREIGVQWHWRHRTAHFGHGPRSGRPLPRDRTHRRTAVRVASVQDVHSAIFPGPAWRLVGLYPRRVPFDWSQPRGGLRPGASRIAGRSAYRIADRVSCRSPASAFR